MAFHGISNGMGDLTLLSNAKSRSLCAENPRGEVGRGGSCPLERTVDCGLCEGLPQLVCEHEAGVLP